MWRLVVMYKVGGEYRYQPAYVRHTHETQQSAVDQCNEWNRGNRHNEDRARYFVVSEQEYQEYWRKVVT